ncbi:N-acylphosphatidylethanolamine synthase [Impatiens glandulifera]|uniref:N-acylphosphatidylethanolamine synthase n=1 Tax=Impatiens glandulifera TaxID=253017 RepID=UPI001FB179BF|nr:N-acylphosphatidylethanolamine synthase [Impatiens glandulifera]
MGGRRRTMEWAAKADHLGGFPRKMIVMGAGVFAKAVANLLNTTTVHNADTLIRLVRSRPPSVPLLTVSNHMSTLDDPVMWGFKGFPTTDAKLARWVLTAEDICFRNSIYSYIFRLGKCIPITRGGGIYQEYMNEALERLSDGEWLHTFPEGKVCQEIAPIGRLKWGTASLIARAPVTPIVLPIIHSGFQEVMPEKFLFGRKRPPFPLPGKTINILIGEPIEFDIPKLTQIAISSSDLSLSSSSTDNGWPNRHGLNQAAQRHLYSAMSEIIQSAMEGLREVGKAFLNK